MATLALIQTFAIGNPQLRQRFAAGRLQVAWNISTNAASPAPQKAWATKIYTDYTGDLDREYLRFLGTSQVQTAGDAITDANLVTAVTGLVTSEWGV